MTTQKKWLGTRAMVPWVVASLVLGLFARATPAEARRGHGGVRAPGVRAPVGVRVVIRPPLFYGVWGIPYYAPYYAPYGYYGYYGPPYQAEGGMSLQIARLNGWGAIDLNIKPRKAEVWVDGRYVATARDLDGYPTYLWLDEGTHTVTLRKGGYQTFEQTFDVHAGEVIPLRLRLAPGASDPPPQR